MPDLAPSLPCRRPELIFRPAGEGGGYVIKGPRADDYFAVGVEEYFLLTQCDGVQSAEVIRDRFTDRFGQTLEPAELDEFLAAARKQGLLRAEEAPGTTVPASRATQNGLAGVVGPQPRRRRVAWQGLLSWRIRLFAPERFFTWAQPRLWFFW